MHRSTYLLLLCAGLLSIAGFLYFIGNALHLPFIIILPFWILTSFYSLRILNRNIGCAAEATWTWRSALHMALLAAALGYLGYQGAMLGEKWGGWDAWSIWNQHAKFLAESKYWQELFSTALAWAHPDYPLLLPGMTAFFLTCCGNNYLIAPYVLAAFFTLCMVAVIYQEVIKENLLAGLLLVPAFITNTYFITQGTSQYADIVLAFYFLAACVSIQTYRSSGNHYYWGIGLFFTACAAFTKNEGLIFAILVIVFYLKDLLTRKNLYVTIIGFGIPMLIWLIFKLFFAPQNDLAAQQDASVWTNLTDKGHYITIFKAWRDNINTHFPWLRLAMFIYAIALVINRKLPGGLFFIVVFTALLCQMTYLFSPYSLEWHLSTSQDRLILQTYPVLIYFAGMQLAAALSRIFNLRGRIQS